MPDESWWYLLRSHAMPTELAYFCFKTSHPGTTIATALVEEGRCLSFTKTACLPTLYVISQATKGPATWCLQMQREANDSHTTNSSGVLPAWITELFPSGLLCFLPVAENLRLHCWLPTSRPDLTAICNSAYTGSPTVCIFVCKMSNLLLVAWLLCEVSRKGSSPRGTAGQWTQKSDFQAHGPRPAPAWTL